MSLESNDFREVVVFEERKENEGVMAKASFPTPAAIDEEDLQAVEWSETEFRLKMYIS